MAHLRGKSGGNAASHMDIEGKSKREEWKDTSASEPSAEKVVPLVSISYDCFALSGLNYGF